MNLDCPPNIDSIEITITEEQASEEPRNRVFLSRFQCARPWHFSIKVCEIGALIGILIGIYLIYTRINLQSDEMNQVTTTTTMKTTTKIDPDGIVIHI